MTSLDTKLRAALDTRDHRQIRRRLPEAVDERGESQNLVDFVSNDYLSLSTSSRLRTAFTRKLAGAPKVLGSGGSRLLVNGLAHAQLERRLEVFFGSPAALLFNSGFDANVGLFSCLPQPGDVVVYDEYIHASVHDGLRASRVRQNIVAFQHNSLSSFRDVLQRLVASNEALVSGESSLFVAVESLYSMDGTFAPLKEMVNLAETFFPARNCHFIVDEAHATGLYGQQGKGLVNHYGLEVFARLHTFGKALAGSGAVLLVTPLVRDYLLNYARSLIYTTTLGYSSIISVDCSFDLLEDGTAEKLAAHLHGLSSYLQEIMQSPLHAVHPNVLSLPTHLLASAKLPSPLFSPIIPFLTSRPRLLSKYLRERGVNACPITWPTVPHGAERVRVCLHAGHSRADVEHLVLLSLKWAKEQVPPIDEDKQVTAKL